MPMCKCCVTYKATPAGSDTDVELTMLITCIQPSRDRTAYRDVFKKAEAAASCAKWSIYNVWAETCLQGSLVGYKTTLERVVRRLVWAIGVLKLMIIIIECFIGQSFQAIISSPHITVLLFEYIEWSPYRSLLGGGQKLSKIFKTFASFQEEYHVGSVQCCSYQICYNRDLARWASGK